MCWTVNFLLIVRVCVVAVQWSRKGYGAGVETGQRLWGSCQWPLQLQSSSAHGKLQLQLTRPQFCHAASHFNLFIFLNKCFYLFSSGVWFWRNAKCCLAGKISNGAGCSGILFWCIKRLNSMQTCPQSISHFLCYNQIVVTCRKIHLVMSCSYISVFVIVCILFLQPVAKIHQLRNQGRWRVFVLSSRGVRSVFFSLNRFASQVASFLHHVLDCDHAGLSLIISSYFLFQKPLSISLGGKCNNWDNRETLVGPF